MPTLMNLSLRLASMPGGFKVLITILAMVSLLSPIDLWPDFLPLGSLDDASLMFVLVGMWSPPVLPPPKPAMATTA